MVYDSVNKFEETDPEFRIVQEVILDDFKSRMTQTEENLRKELSQVVSVLLDNSSEEHERLGISGSGH